MGSAQIVISSVSQPTKTWSSANQLRIGRLPDLEVVVDDVSISRRHAELTLGEEGWTIRDLGSMNGSYLNGVRIGRTAHRVRQGDAVRVGNIDLKIDALRGQPSTISIGGQRAVQVEVTSKRSWDEAVETFDIADDRWQRDGKAFLQLMRAGYRLAHTATPDELVQRVLDDTLRFFNAQRAGIFLTDSNNQLVSRSTSNSGSAPPGDRILCRTPAQRAFASRESILFKNCQEVAELQSSSSVSRASVSSIICAVLRSPDQAFGVLHLERGIMQEAFTETDLYLADSLAAALVLGLERLQMIERQQELFLHTVTALAQAVEMRDSYTGDHTHRVTSYAMVLAEELGIAPEQRKILRAAAALHDIGKIAIDDQILRKPGRLSDAEFRQMKTHVTRGWEIIQMIPGLGWALPVVRGHHERWDGTGYPDGLRGEGIPLLARVVSVADAFDAMTSDRPYRKGMTTLAAFSELQTGSGRQFDPACVDAFIRARPRIEALLNQEKAFRLEAERETGTITVSELRRQLEVEFPDSGVIQLPEGPASLRREQ